VKCEAYELKEGIMTDTYREKISEAEEKYNQGYLGFIDWMLTAKKKYYVQIRTYTTINGTKYYSSWSKAKIVTTKK
jgi:hypothetical protein